MIGTKTVDLWLLKVYQVASKTDLKFSQTEPFLFTSTKNGEDCVVAYDVGAKLVSRINLSKAFPVMVLKQ